MSGPDPGSQVVSREPHDRGQIAMLLRQAGLRLLVEVAIHGLWQRLYWRDGQKGER